MDTTDKYGGLGLQAIPSSVGIFENISRLAIGIEKIRGWRGGGGGRGGEEEENKKNKTHENRKKKIRCFPWKL